LYEIRVGAKPFTLQGESSSCWSAAESGSLGWGNRIKIPTRVYKYRLHPRSFNANYIKSPSETLSLLPSGEGPGLGQLNQEGLGWSNRIKIPTRVYKYRLHLRSIKDNYIKSPSETLSLLPSGEGPGLGQLNQEGLGWGNRIKIPTRVYKYRLHLRSIKDNYINFPSETLSLLPSGEGPGLGQLNQEVWVGATESKNHHCLFRIVTCSFQN